MPTIHPERDPMGQAMLDFLKEEHEPFINVHSDLEGEDELPVPYLFRPLSEMPELEKKALVECKGHVLDIGAGAGSHSLALQDLGHRVQPIDASPGAVQCMQQRGLNHAQLADLYEFGEGQYDTILLLMNGIGLAGNIPGLEQMLSHFKSLLKPGGQILCDSADIIYAFEEEDGSQRIDMKRSYYGEVIYTMQYKHILGDPFSWLYIDYDTLVKKAEQAGYTAEYLFEGEDGHYLTKLVLA